MRHYIINGKVYKGNSQEEVRQKYLEETGENIDISKIKRDRFSDC